MAYDEDLSDRVRALLSGERGVTEKRMFGGLAFLVHGHMAVSANSHGGLMVRCAPEQTQQLVDSTAAVPMVMRGRELDGWLQLPVADINGDDDLRRWVDIGAAHARSLPPKR